MMSEKWYNNSMEKLVKQVADHLGIESLDIRYEEMEDDSRLM